MASNEVQLGTIMRVLGVMFDSKLSWQCHITHISYIIEKKVHTLWKISTDLNPSKLLSTSHGNVLCSRHLVKWRFTRKTPQKTQGSHKLNAADCIWEEEARMQHSGAAQSSKHAETFTDGTALPWVLFDKRRIKTTMVTKNWTSKVGLSDFSTKPSKIFCS